MALRMRNSKQYLALALVVGGLLVSSLYFVTRPKETALAAGPLSPSVLCAPNNCNLTEGQDSVQDIRLVNKSTTGGQDWKIDEDANTNGDADRQVLEIANQQNHYMEQVIVGVYVTDDIYNTMMPGTPLRLNFVNRICKQTSNPYWDIVVREPGTSNETILQRYDEGKPVNDGGQGEAAENFCNNAAMPVNFNLSSHKSKFVAYNGGSLWYTEIVVRFVTYDPTPPDESRNVRFQMRLDNVCGALTTCREYLAMVTSDLSGEPRNVALSVLNPQQKRVTNSAAEQAGDPSTYDLFTPSYTQRMIRQYMEFGLPCSNSTGGVYPIHLYDINDGDNAGAETHGWVGAKDIIGVVIQYYDELSNSWLMVPSTSIASISGGGYALNPPPTSTAISTRNHFLYGIAGDSEPSQVIIPTEADRVDTVISVNLNPRTKYRLAITPVSPVNFLAAGLPGDQIYGIAGCDSFGLTPAVTGSGTVFPGAAADFSNTIGSDPSSGSPATDVKWQAYGFVVRNGQPMPTIGGDTTTDYSNAGLACSGLQDCQVIGSNLSPGVTILPNTQLFVGNTTYSNTGGLGAGDQVCSFLAISPFQIPSGTNTWRVSNMTCLPVVSVPTVQIRGNDLRVGSSFTGGTNLTSEVNAFVASGRASWVEYAITAPGTVSNLASQSGAVNGNSAAQSAWSKLTFANTSVPAACTTSFGCFTDTASLGSIPDVQIWAQGFPGLSYNAGGGGFAASGIPAIVAGANLANFGQSAVIVTTGDIDIDQDITYSPGPHAGSQNIPQLVLIGNNINIRAGVRNVDAWLVATDTVNTCSDVPAASLRSDNCNNQLRINGPIMASQLALQRTYNNSAQPQEAAEVINLRGDAFIWANRLSRQNGTWQTVYTTELPPRY